MSSTTPRTHPSELELATLVDEPESGLAGTREHVNGCGPCRERVAEIEATRAALALDPPMPSEAEFAAQLERIRAAIEASTSSTGKPAMRRAAWILPLAAAAAIAAVLLVGDLRSPGETGPRAIDQNIRPPIPMLAEAREAAEDVPVEAIDDDALDAALAAAEPLAPPISVERTAALESEFAGLPEEEQSAVLVELAGADFDL
jgi:hypothetical protein